MNLRVLRSGFCVLVLCAFALEGCPALYPEIGTPIRPAPAGKVLEPSPPEDVLFLRFQKAWIPLRTRDGRAWTGGAPDPYAVLLVNDKQLIRTPIQSHTHEPTWPSAAGANYRVKPGSRVVVELWDDSTFQQYPICAKDVEDLHSSAVMGSLDLVCDMGARVTLMVEPARAKVGLGMWYELRSEAVYITRVLEASPAGRARLRPGQRVLSIQGEPVATMDDARVRSLINANLKTELLLTVLEPNGKTRTAHIKEGPIYPLADEGIALD